MNFWLLCVAMFWNWSEMHLYTWRWLVCCWALSSRRERFCLCRAVCHFELLQVKASPCGNSQGKRETMKTNPRLRYREVLLCIDRVQPFPWNMYSFHFPRCLQKPWIMAVVLHFTPLHMKPGDCWGCLNVSHDRWEGFRAEGMVLHILPSSIF